MTIKTAVAVDAQTQFAKVAKAVGVSSQQFLRMCTTTGLKGSNLRAAEEAAGGSVALFSLINEVTLPAVQI